MNKIVIKNNKIKNYQDDNIKIKDNHFLFKQNGDYEIEYLNSTKVDFIVELEEDVYIKLFIYLENNDVEINNQIILNDRANLLIFKFYYSKKIKEKVEVNLNGFASKINCCFSNIVSNNEKYHMIINHNNNKTISNISNKSITLDDAKIDFTIDSHVYHNCSECVLNQSTKIIVLDKNNAIIRPNMYIDKYDVEAKHSSVIGKFNEEDLFYLMTRGIPRQDATKLLIKGFILSHLIVDMDKRAKILNIINNKWR